MSAFVVDRMHIHAMVAFGLIRRHASDLSWYHAEERHRLTWETRDRVGQMLTDECVASVLYRYSDSPADDLPGHYPDGVADWLAPYTYRTETRAPRAMQMFGVIRCYTYQSCEHPDWEASEAKAFCDQLLWWAIGLLGGDGADVWEWTQGSEDAIGGPDRSIPIFGRGGV